jgi:hypothetical protein
LWQTRTDDEFSYVFPLTNQQNPKLGSLNNDLAEQESAEAEETPFVVPSRPVFSSPDVAAVMQLDNIPAPPVLFVHYSFSR